MALIIEIVSIKYFPLLLRAPYHFLYPAILVLSFVGAYTNANNMFAFYCAIGFSLLGLWMNYDGIPATPFILSYVLGSMLETNFRKAISYAKGDWTTFFTRPVSCILLVAAIAMVVWSFVKDKLPQKEAKNV